MRLNRGALIVIEGLDGSGKTTQARMLGERLADLGLRVAQTHEPTDGAHGRRLGVTGLTPEEQFDASVLDRREHVTRELAPALEAGAVVIVDRYYLSSMADHGARGIDPELIRATSEDFAPVPDIVFLLEISPEHALERVRARDGTGEDGETIERLRKAAALFSALPDDELHIVRLDAQAPIGALHDRICRELHDGPMFDASCKKRGKQGCEPYCGLRELCAFPELRPLAPYRSGDPGAA